MPKEEKKPINSREKAAMLMVALGPDLSGRIFKNLSDEEIENLTIEISNLKFLNSDNKNLVIKEFYELCLAQDYIDEGGITYAKMLLDKSLGSQKAIDILNKLTPSLQVRPFEFVRKADPTQVLNFIQNEHPQTIALILSYMKPEQAAQVLSALSTERQSDVTSRIAKMDRTSPDVVNEVEKILEKKISTLVNQDFNVVGGLKQIVEILNSVDRGTERHIMESLEIEDTELAEEIKKRMFVFEDILLMDNRSVQRFLREVENQQLSLALKSATEELKDLIFRNVSKRMADMIREDMEFMGPVKIKDVEDAQQGIVNIIRKLEESGEIIISRGGSDGVVL